MARSEDLDVTIDGFDPGDVVLGGTRLRQASRRRTQAPVAQPIAGNFEQPRQQADPAPRPVQAPEPEPKRRRRDDDRDDRVPSIVRFLTDERLRLFLGIALLLACVFIIIALVSHFKNGPIDQSAVMNSSLSEMAADPGAVRNVGGGFGAWLAHVMFCNALGIGSAVLIVYAWLLALALLGMKKVNFWSLTFKTLLVSVTISIVMGLVTYSSDSPLSWGGTHGHYVNKFLISHAGAFGAILVSSLLVLAVVCVYLNELHTAWSKWKEGANRRRLQDELTRLRRNKVAYIEDKVAAPAVEAKPEAEQPQPQRVQVDVPATTDEQANVPHAESFTFQIAPVASTASTDKALDSILADDAPEGFSFEVPATGSEAVAAVVEALPEAASAVAPVGPSSVAEAQPESPKPEGSFSFSIDNVAPQLPQAETAPQALQQADKEEQMPPVDAPAQVGDGAFSIVAPQIEEADEFKSDAGDSPAADRPDAVGSPLLGGGLDTPYDHRAELPRFQFPPIDLLAVRDSGPVVDMDEQQANKDRIVKTLLDYKIPISRIEATVGPTVTLYEIVPAEGVRISQIKRLEDDIALSLSALGIRIIAPIPGKGTVGIEVPNKDPRTVSMRSVITSKKYQDCKMALPMAMGATINNEIFIADLAKMPHLLVAGATGMGKSVGLNAILASLLYKKHPSELKLVLVDPKMVEFSLYGKLERHYLAKLPGEDDAIITDMGKVIQTLNSLCVEMESRYELLRDANVRSLEEYNKKFTDRRLNPEKGHKYLPYIVVVIDEFADLIMTQGKEVETPIARIAQKARAVGIHLILATQRPSTNVITGIIKANFPGRIAFRVAQMVDSKTILDRTGANQLIGKGDMLFSHNGSLERVQCAFISTEEVEAITECIDNQVGYEHAYYLPEYEPEGGEGPIAGASTERDALFDEAARFVVQRQVGSTSSLQRQFNIGYNRAGRLMDQMEAAGIIGPVNGSKPRAILVDSMSLEYILGQNQ